MGSKKKVVARLREFMDEPDDDTPPEVLLEELLSWVGQVEDLAERRRDEKNDAALLLLRVVMHLKSEALDARLHRTDQPIPLPVELPEAFHEDTAFTREALALEARAWLEEAGFQTLLDGLNCGPGNFKVVLTDAGDRKLAVIREIRRFSMIPGHSVTIGSDGEPGITLKDAKDGIDNPPFVVVKGVDHSFAEVVKRALEDAHGVAQITEEV